MSLRLRLNLLITLLNLGFLLALAGLLVSQHRAAIREEIEAAHRVTVQLIAGVAQTSPVFGPAPVVMGDYLHRLGRVRANDIVLERPDGQVLYRSPPSPYKAGQRAPVWFEHLMQPAINATILSLPGARLRIIPDASRATLDAWEGMRGVLGLGLGFVLLLHALLVFLLRHLLRPTEATSQQLVETKQALVAHREVTRLIEEGIEAERKRLSRELHDELGQSVTAIRLIATTLARGGTMPAEQGLEKINEIAAGLYDSVHRIVRELRPAVLDNPDLADALRDLAQEWRHRHPDIEFTLDLEGDLGDLGERLTLAVYRSVQEALTNVLKHAQARRVQVRAQRSDDVLRVRIVDDGEPNQARSGLGGSGLGLAGMRERIVALGGTVDAGPGPENGFSVSIALPLEGDWS